MTKHNTFLVIALSGNTLDYNLYS